MAQAKDYYQILGVASSASDGEIKKAYRNLAKKYHPDANPDNQAAAEKFKEISEAHAVLSDPERRKKYDAMRRLGAFGGVGGGSPFSTGKGGGGIRFEDLDFGRGGGAGFGGIGDLFSSIFGFGKRDASPEPVELSVSVPFRTAALGGKIPVEVGVSDSCPNCGGSGAAPGAQIEICDECKGRGTVSFGQGSFAVNRPCPACRGRGRKPSEPCQRCGGSGDVDVTKKIMVTVPPGTDTGQRVRLKGQGQKSAAGGPSGDLVITFEVRPDRFFRRDGLNIYCTVPINLVQAVLGTKIKVKTLSGGRVVLKVPPGTQPGRKFRIKGQGIEKHERRGDQYVEVDVTVPEQLNPEQEKLIKEFASSAGLKY